MDFSLWKFPVNVSGTRYESLGTFVGKYPMTLFSNSYSLKTVRTID